MNDLRNLDPGDPIDAAQLTAAAREAEGKDVGPNTFTTQEGAVFGMDGATCPNGHESNLEHRIFPSGYFRCPTCDLLYDEPMFDMTQFVTVIGDD